MNNMKKLTLAVMTALALISTSCSKENETINPLLGTYQLSTTEINYNNLISVTSESKGNVLLTITGYIINATGDGSVNESKQYSADGGKLKITGDMDKVLYLSTVQDYRVTKDSLIISNVSKKQLSITYRLVRK